MDFCIEHGRCLFCGFDIPPEITQEFKFVAVVEYFDECRCVMRGNASLTGFCPRLQKQGHHFHGRDTSCQTGEQVNIFLAFNQVFHCFDIIRQNDQFQTT